MDRQDRRLVVEALAQVGMAGQGGRVFATLSGGEKQRVLFARALAQQRRLLLLDEPTNHLDVCAQLELLALIRRLRMTTLAALHDLNLAATFCDRLYGRVVADGPIAEVLTPPLLAEVFGVTAHCGPHPVTGHFHVVYLPPPELNGHQPPRSATAHGG